MARPQEAIEQRWVGAPLQDNADSGICEIEALQKLVKQKIEAYASDSNLGRILNDNQLHNLTVLASLVNVIFGNVAAI